MVVKKNLHPRNPCRVAARTAQENKRGGSNYSKTVEPKDGKNVSSLLVCQEYNISS